MYLEERAARLNKTLSVEKNKTQIVGHMNVETINRLLDEINEDRSVPKNIRNSITEAKQHLNSNADVAVKVNSAVSILDEISNDPNIPTYTRTQIWNIVSMLEIIDK